MIGAFKPRSFQGLEISELLPACPFAFFQTLEVPSIGKLSRRFCDKFIISENFEVLDVVPLTCIHEAVIVRRAKRTFPEYR